MSLSFSISWSVLLLFYPCLWMTVSLNSLSPWLSFLVFLSIFYLRLCLSVCLSFYLYLFTSSLERYLYIGSLYPWCKQSNTCFLNLSFPLFHPTIIRSFIKPLNIHLDLELPAISVKIPQTPILRYYHCYFYCMVTG